MVTKAIWPLNPDHITNSSDGELEGLGIVPRGKLETDLSGMAGRIENPVMLMEFPKISDKPPRHTQVRAIQFEQRPACERFRKQTDSEHCKDVENRVANLLRDLDVGDLEERFRSPQTAGQVASIYEGVRGFCFELRAQKGKQYLEFDCPILGYRALAFPVVIESRILGVLYVGELCLTDRLDFIKQVMQNSEIRYEGVLAGVLSQHERWADNQKRVLSQEEYHDLVTKALDEVTKLEASLADELHRLRVNFIEKKVAGYVSALYHDLPTMSSRVPRGTAGLKVLWSTVERQLDEIRKDFKVDYIRLFGTRVVQLKNPSELDMVCRTPDSTGRRAYQIEPTRIKYDLNKIPKESMTHIMVSTIHPELLEAVTNHPRLDTSTDFIRVFPASYSPASMLVTWIGYGPQWNPLLDKRYEQSAVALDRSIRSFYAVVVSTHASILASTAQDNMEKTLRVYKHEMSQLTSGMDALRETYISNAEKLKEMSPKKASDLNGDIESYLRHIHLLTGKAGMTLDIPRPRKSHFPAISELLYKAKDTFRLDADGKQIQFHIPQIDIKDPLRSPVYGDQAQLEQLLYNLLTNARKYCHPGTKIRMDCRKNNSAEISPHVLTVVNYGVDIEKSRKVYDLEYRGHNVAGVEGVGIGLYIVSQIAEAHGGNVVHECTKICGYNVPLMQAFLESGLQTDNGIDLQDMQEKLDELKTNNLYQNVVALNEDGSLKQSAPTSNELIDLIDKPTFEVTFNVTIPSF